MFPGFFRSATKASKMTFRWWQVTIQEMVNLVLHMRANALPHCERKELFARSALPRHAGDHVAFECPQHWLLGYGTSVRPEEWMVQILCFNGYGARIFYRKKVGHRRNVVILLCFKCTVSSPSPFHGHASNGFNDMDSIDGPHFGWLRWENLCYSNSRCTLPTKCLLYFIYSSISDTEQIYTRTIFIKFFLFCKRTVPNSLGWTIPSGPREKPSKTPVAPRW